MPRWDAVFHGTSEKVVARLRLRICPSSNASCPLCLHPRIASLGFSWTLMKWMGGQWFGIFKSTLILLRRCRTLCSLPRPCYFQPAFCLWKILVKEYVEPESWESRTAKENRQRRWNNNHVVRKHREGPVFPPQGEWILFWVISCELSCRRWKPLRVDKINTCWRDCTRDGSCPVSGGWFQGDGKTGNCWLTVLKTVTVMLVRPLTTDLKMAFGADFCFCKEPPPSVYKSSCPTVCQLWGGAVSPWTEVHPPTPVVCLWTKADFSF